MAVELKANSGSRAHDGHPGKRSHIPFFVVNHGLLVENRGQLMSLYDLTLSILLTALSWSILDNKC
jgi:hypothetical protein